MKLGALQNGRWDPKSLDDKEVKTQKEFTASFDCFFLLQLTTSQFKLPLVEVRPECAGIIRNLPVTEPPLTPPDQSQSPYFMDNEDPEKYLKQGEKVRFIANIFELDEKITIYQIF